MPQIHLFDHQPHRLLWPRAKTKIWLRSSKNPACEAPAEGGGLINIGDLS